jgi:hypothetical protein
MHDSFDSDCMLANTEEDYVIAHCGQSRICTEFGPQPIDLWLFGYFPYPRAEQPKHSCCMAWAIQCDVFRYLFEVSRYARR